MELDISKYQTATVTEDGVFIHDDQHGEVRVSAETFERLYQALLEERGVGEFITVSDN